MIFFFSKINGLELSLPTFMAHQSVQIFTEVRLRTYKHTKSHTRTHIHTDTHTRTLTCTQTHIQLSARAYIHTYTYTCIHTAQIHVHTQTHIHTPHKPEKCFVSDFRAPVQWLKVIRSFIHISNQDSNCLVQRRSGSLFAVKDIEEQSQRPKAASYDLPFFPSRLYCTSRWYTYKTG